MQSEKFRRFLSDCIRKTALYEDTGLSPSKIPYLEHIAFSLTKGDPAFLDRILELTQADEEGRITIHPCKVGDTVYTKKDPVGLKLHGFQTEAIVGAGAIPIEKFWDFYTDGRTDGKGNSRYRI